MFNKHNTILLVLSFYPLLALGQNLSERDYLEAFSYMWNDIQGHDDVLNLDSNYSIFIAKNNRNVQDYFKNKLERMMQEDSIDILFTDSTNNPAQVKTTLIDSFLNVQVDNGLLKKSTNSVGIVTPNEIICYFVEPTTNLLGIVLVKRKSIHNSFSSNRRFNTILTYLFYKKADKLECVDKQKSAWE